VGAICWAAGDALKQYFKACRQGIDPDIDSLRDSFARTLRMKLKSATAGAEKVASAVKKPTAESPNLATTATKAESSAQGATLPVSDALEQIALLHELHRSGALSKDEYEKKKTELLKRI